VCDQECLINISDLILKQTKENFFYGRTLSLASPSSSFKFVPKIDLSVYYDLTYALYNIVIGRDEAHVFISKINA
jgi:hypothetical protein